MKEEKNNGRCWEHTNYQFYYGGSAWAICVLLNSIKDDIIGLVELLKEMKKDNKKDEID